MVVAVLEFDESARRGTDPSDEVTFCSSSEAQLRGKILSCSEILDGDGVVELIRWFDLNRPTGVARVERRRLLESIGSERPDHGQVE